jgi:hypothetical protein
LKNISIYEFAICGRVSRGQLRLPHHQGVFMKEYDAPVTLPHFMTEACIIQEQEEHLVLAVRIPKAVIEANLPLLAGLVRRVGGKNAQGTAG